MKNLMKLMMVLILGIFLVACKTPSATDPVDPVDPTDPTDPTDPAVVDNLGSAGGVWRGTFTPSNQADYSIRFYKVMITPGVGGNVVMLSDNESSLEIQGSDMLKSTSFVQTSAEITINLKEFKKENVVAPVDVEMTAQLTPAGKIEGTYTRGVEAGAVLLEYDPIYELQNGIEAGEDGRVAFFYTENTYWRLSKATLIEGVAGSYHTAFSIDDSFNMPSRNNGGVIYTYTTDKVGSADADDAVILSEEALTKASEVVIAQAAVNAANTVKTDAETAKTNAETDRDTARTDRDTAIAGGDDTVIAAAEADLAAAEAILTTATADLVTATVDLATANADLFAAQENANLGLTFAINAVNAAISSAITAGDPNAGIAGADIVGYIANAGDTTAQVNAKANGLAATLTASDELFEYTEQRLGLPGGATLISFAFPVLEADSEGCSYAGNFDIVDPRFFMYNVTFDVTGATCSLNGVYTGMAALEEEFQPLDVDGAELPHTQYQFLTFGVSSTTTGKTINNRLTLSFFGS